MKEVLISCAALICLSLEPGHGIVNHSLKGPVPQIQGKWWQVAGNPDLGTYTKKDQQPVDFGIWQAADGTWQLWSCIRGTNCGGKGRLFYRWQSDKITDANWRPMGVAMQADTSFGEVKGGLQAPYVIKVGTQYVMFYGDWEGICMAKGMDGKAFSRQFYHHRQVAMFSEGKGNNTRDPMVIHMDGTYYAYYTAFPNGYGADYVRTSTDLMRWSSPKVVAFGGAAGAGKFSAECPFVYFDKSSGYYFLFRTQRYGEAAQTSVYRSRNPMDFGVNDDRFLVTTLPIAAPEIVEYHGQLYIASLLPNLKGIRIAKLRFVQQ